MDKQRLEAFTDGVIAIIITIMVLEIKMPAGADLGALRAGLPVFLAYLLSFTNVAIFWNNHHHMLHATERINGAVLWANMTLLFWMSLVPFAIRWMDETHFAAAPTALYGAVLAATSISYVVLERCIILCNGPGSQLERAVGSDTKAKVSLMMYVAAIPLAFVRPWIAIVVYVLIAGVWLVPDRRIEGMQQSGGGA
jgi:uncharacterized membrane protein